MKYLLCTVGTLGEMSLNVLPSLHLGFSQTNVYPDDFRVWDYCLGNHNLKEQKMAMLSVHLFESDLCERHHISVG